MKESMYRPSGEDLLKKSKDLDNRLKKQYESARTDLRDVLRLIRNSAGVNSI